MARVTLDVPMTAPGKRALFSILWAMARVDGHICLSEEGLLRRIHRELFGAELSTWVQPQDFTIAAAAAALDGPSARRLVLELLYEMMEVDGLQLDDELALFAACAREIGLEEPEVRQAWTDAARTIYEKAARDLVERRFSSLGRELARLRKSLLLDATCDRVAEATVRQALDTFRVP